MKRFLMIFTALSLLFTAIGTPIADAKGASGGGGRSSSSVSKPASTSKATSSSTKTDKAAKTDKTAKTNKATKTAEQPQRPTTTQVSTFKHKPSFSTSYAKPKTTNVKYENKSYYSNDSGFMTTVATSIGTYLVLDAIMDNGDPVYIDSETGEQIDADELDELADQQDTDSSDGWAIFFFIMALLTLAIIAAIIFL